MPATNGDRAGRPRRPSQRRRLAVDREAFSFYHDLMGYPKVTVAEVRGYALGGGFEMALMADISVVARDAKIGMPATRFLGPALGFAAHVLPPAGPGARPPAAADRRHRCRRRAFEHLTVFTEVVDDAQVAARADWYARKIAKMPADGIVMAKEAFRLVEQLQAYSGEEVASYLFHAFGTNLQFEDGRVQLREGARRARHQARLRAARRALRGSRAVAGIAWNI